VTRAALALALLAACTEAAPVRPDATAFDARVDDVPATRTDAPTPRTDAALDPDATVFADIPDVPAGPDAPLPDAGAPANNTCARATAVPPEGTIYGNVPADRGEEAACNTALPALWYRVAVRRGQRVTAAVVDKSVERVGVFVALLPACGGPCLDPGPSTGFASWTNEGADTEVRVALWAPAGAMRANAQLSVGVAPAAPDATCLTASPLPSESSVQAQVSRSIAAPPACLAQPTWRANFYRGVIPPGHTLLARTPPGTTTPNAFALLGSCEATACLATSARTPAGGVALRHTNTGTAPLGVVLAVAGNPVGVGGLEQQVSVDVNIAETPSYGACAAARAVRDGDVLPAERPLFATEPAPACGQTGPETGALYYAARVGPGEELVVNARSNNATPGLRLLDRCGATACLAQTPSPGSSISRLAWTNEATAPRDLVVALSYPGELQPPPSRVSVTVRPQPYRAAVIRAACDDMTGAAVYVIGTSVIGTQERRSVPLPFAFPWYGATMRHLTPSPQGFAELWAEPFTAGLSMGPPGFVPTSVEQNLLAPFWESYSVDARNAMRTRAFDGPPRRFTVEWGALRTLDGAEGPWTFQLKLFEDGAAEFHYCALGTSPRATGGGASIGVQGGSGPQGLSYAFQRAGAVATGGGLRFTR